ncbi:response regulator transcription factor [Paenibacillus allorhizosphaerae]|uniref:Heme response regulator HssR n=1 Tax=Paenibacillus allorhizosphaerae TaxID=2849866 RepID=A0ABN7THY7_9BACL|nr:response regulator transcription factor [Paenibacillus allorhizosphaerae]CAG7623026.1 Heme response regulator HssR [Paenibacillus allorhizosphaerae]
MAKILLVDDDNYIRELMKASLHGEGFALFEARNGREALEQLERRPVDLVILDVMMPLMDGWELCRELRRLYPDLPMLMVTARTETMDKVKGFELGTDDYLVKPFDPPELVARVKALLKRYRIASSQVIRLGEVELNRSSFEVSRGRERMSLPPKEFELLFKLAAHPNQIFTRNQLIEQIWGIDYEGDDRTVDVHIKRLRERFPEPIVGFAIRTIRGLGYKLEVLA